MIALQRHPGRLTAVVGPIGAGKSTLVGLRTGHSGECRFDGAEVSRWNRRDAMRSTDTHAPPPRRRSRRGIRADVRWGGLATRAPIGNRRCPKEARP
jgi:ABC-type branched-subunit amino acid transport system ATPase component